MTLAAQLRFFRSGFYPLVLAAMAAVAVPGILLDLSIAAVLSATCAAGVALLVAWRPLVSGWLTVAMRHRARQLETARTNGDDATIERLFGEMEACYHASNQAAYAAYTRGTLLSHHERWNEARAVLATITPSPTDRALFDNACAWSLAHDGATGEAVTLATANVERIPMVAESWRPYLWGTLGAALVRDGRFADAIEPLRKASELGGPGWAMAVRCYYMGEALSALKRTDEARTAWELACAIAPQSRYGVRAAARLAAPSPNAYR